MPISPENAKLYPGGSINSPEWKVIRGQILNRAGGRCEWCRAPNRKVIARGQGKDRDTYMLFEGDVFCAISGERLGLARMSDYNSGATIKVVLTIAHLDHNPTNNADDNLAALCQRCHNRHDAPHRRKNAAKTRHAKKGMEDMFGYA